MKKLIQNYVQIPPLFHAYSPYFSLGEVLYATDAMNNKEIMGNGEIEINISGEITDREAFYLIKRDLGRLTERVFVEHTNKLTTLDLSALNELVDLKVNENSALQYLDISNLTKIHGDFEFNNNKSLTNLNLSRLKYSKSIRIKGANNTTALSSIDLSSLNESHELHICRTNVLSLNLLNLEVCIEGIYIRENNRLASINLSSFKRTTYLNFVRNSLTRLDLTQFEEGNINVIEPLMTSISVPTLSDFISFSVSGKLCSDQVNKLLSSFVAVSSQLKYAYINLSNQSSPAPPTGDAVSNKYTLISLGNSVYTF